MLSWFVGNVDVPAAAVLIAIVAGFAISFSTVVAIYQSKQDISNKFELARMAQAAETAAKMEEMKRSSEKYLAQLTSQREIEFKRIESGMVDLKVARPNQQNYNEDRG